MLGRGTARSAPIARSKSELEAGSRGAGALGVTARAEKTGTSASISVSSGSVSSGYDEKKSRDRVIRIYDTIYEIAERARKAMQPTYRIADTIVEEKLAKAGK